MTFVASGSMAAKSFTLGWSATSTSASLYGEEKRTFISVTFHQFVVAETAIELFGLPTESVTDMYGFGALMTRTVRVTVESSRKSPTWL